MCIKKNRYKSNQIIKKQPKISKYYIFAVGLTVVPGILLGALIAKSIANILEMYNLYSPDDLTDYDDD